MEYGDFIRQVRELGFITSDEAADAAVKAVLGILASAVKAPQAERLTGKLPGPLTFGELRSHQITVALKLSVTDYIEEIRHQFGLSTEQAAVLVNKVLHLAKTAAGAEVMNDVMSVLPEDWDRLIRES